MLSERLQELEAAGLVERTVYPETPVRIDYTLTAEGRSLERVFEAIAEWAHDCMGEGAGSDDRAVGRGPAEVD